MPGHLLEKPGEILEFYYFEKVGILNFNLTLGKIQFPALLLLCRVALDGSRNLERGTHGPALPPTPGTTIAQSC